MIAGSEKETEVCKGDREKKPLKQKFSVSCESAE
jgi:hypothetical protein